MLDQDLPDSRNFYITVMVNCKGRREKYPMMIKAGTQPRFDAEGIGLIPIYTDHGDSAKASLP